MSMIDNPSHDPTSAPSEKASSGKRRTNPASGELLDNDLLAAVPLKEQRRMLGMLEPVKLTFGEVLYEPGDVISHVYFPGISLVSLLTLVDNHLALEVGIVGREGMVGIPLSLGVGISTGRALVQGAGVAMRMKSALFLKEMRKNRHLQRALNLYINQLMSQVAQTAACNRFHFVEERLARWLLMTRDRVQSMEFPMTQEFLSHMLGVRRVGVTKAAIHLQKLRLIEYSRGNIRILNAQGLEAAACSCYQVLRNPRV
jgi:CRP-like cAMP-binding protein